MSISVCVCVSRRGGYIVVFILTEQFSDGRLVYFQGLDGHEAPKHLSVRHFFTTNETKFLLSRKT